MRWREEICSIFMYVSLYISKHTSCQGPCVIFQSESPHLEFFFFLHIFFWPLLHIPLLATRQFACCKQQELSHRGHQCIKENIRYFWMLSKTSFDFIKGTQQCKTFLLHLMEQHHLRRCVYKEKRSCSRLHLSLGNHRNKVWGKKLWNQLGRRRKVHSEILALVIPWYSSHLRIWVVFAREHWKCYFISYCRICSKSQ